MRIMWSHRDPSVRRSNVGNIFIKVLSSYLFKLRLTPPLMPYLALAGARRRHRQPHETCDFIGRVNHESELLRARRPYAHDTCSTSRLLQHSHSERPDVHETEQPDAAFLNNSDIPRVQNLDKSIDNKALHDTFSAFGTILSSKVALDPAGESKGYGFVHYELDESAQLAIEKVHQMYNSRQWSCLWSFMDLSCRVLGLRRC